MLRRTPMKRTAFRGSSRTSKYARRQRHVPYMLFVKTLPCAAKFMSPETSPCSGPVEADHAGLRGTGEKAHDSTVIPLCTQHHYERTNFSGLFKTYDQGQMRSWLVGRILQTQRTARARRIVVPEPEEQKIRPLGAM